MDIVVYVLCTVASIVCAALLFSSWRASRASLLLWTMVCFVGLALNNVLLLIDEVIAPDVELATLRAVPALAGVMALVYGLVRETRS